MMKKNAVKKIQIIHDICLPPSCHYGCGYKRYNSASFVTSLVLLSIHAHVQTVTSVLLLVGSPLCLGCMCGEWP